MCRHTNPLSGTVADKGALSISGELYMRTQEILHAPLDQGHKKQRTSISGVTRTSLNFWILCSVVS